jgi:hypothetical protein
MNLADSEILDLLPEVRGTRHDQGWRFMLHGRVVTPTIRRLENEGRLDVYYDYKDKPARVVSILRRYA